MPKIYKLCRIQVSVMWFGTKEQLKTCPLLSKESKESVLAFFNAHDFQTLENGRYDLAKDNFVNLFEYDSKENDGVFEAHKAYIDIHYVILGEEKTLFADKYTKETQGYDQEKDCSFGLVENAKECTLQGELCVFLPEEVHKGGVLTTKAMHLKKAVFKIKAN